MAIPPIGGPPPSSSYFGASAPSDPTPPSVPLYNAATTLWALLSNVHPPLINSPQDLDLFATTVNAFLAQCNPPSSLDPATLAIYQLLNQPLTTGSSITLASLCAESSSQRSLDLGAHFQDVLPIAQSLQDHICGGNGVTDWFHLEYPNDPTGEPPTTMPPDLDFYYTRLCQDLQGLNKWQNDPDSSEYKDYLNSVANDILSIYKSLTNPGSSLDGYGQLVLDFLTGPLNAAVGTDSLYSIAAALIANNGAGSDPTDATKLMQWLYNPPAPNNPPFTAPITPVASNLIGWLANILNSYEFPQP